MVILQRWHVTQRGTLDALARVANATAHAEHGSALG